MTKEEIIERKLKRQADRRLPWRLKKRALARLERRENKGMGETWILEAEKLWNGLRSLCKGQSTSEARGWPMD